MLSNLLSMLNVSGSIISLVFKIYSLISRIKIYTRPHLSDQYRITNFGLSLFASRTKKNESSTFTPIQYSIWRKPPFRLRSNCICLWIVDPQKSSISFFNFSNIDKQSKMFRYVIFRKSVLWLVLYVGETGIG